MVSNAEQNRKDTDSAKTCLIKLKDVHKSDTQPNGQQITILEKINIELFTREIAALLDPSGSGIRG